VTITDEGRTVPVMCSPAPGVYGEALEAVRRLVARAKVTGVFLSSEPSWGQPVTGKWQHMAVIPPPALVLRATALKTAGQAMAERREEYGMICRGLADFSAEVVTQALAILNAEALYRAEKVLGPAKWLAALQATRAGAKGSQARDNLTWRAVATAPPGFCHVRSTMIGTLLEDLAAGLPFADVKARFAAKMSPLQYQRPQAAPAAGNIAQAEKVVAELGAAGALARRFARLEDLQTIWTQPRKAEQPAPPTGGVFAGLTPKGKGAKAPALDLPTVPMTWAKFRDTVLPTAERIEYLVPRGTGHYLALVTAANPEAPPILQWDREDRRNPVNWYVYPGGSYPERWNLTGGQWVAVNAMTLLPHMWDTDHPCGHQGEGVVAILDGCRDTQPNGGSALFPEVLRSEFHAVRATIEAFSRAATIAGKDEATACGIDLRKGGRWQHTVRVAAGAVQSTYLLDRWD
jgi:hypothetical protein